MKLKTLLDQLSELHNRIYEFGLKYHIDCEHCILNSSCKFHHENSDSYCCFEPTAEWKEQHQDIEV